LGVSEEFTDDGLREKLLGDDSARRQLNQVLHSEIFAAILEARAQVVEIPLLVEAVLFPFFDETWFISAQKEVIEERLTARLGNAEAGKKLLSTQLPQEVKSLFCTRVIDNSGTLTEFQLAVEEAARSCQLLG
jgi:dephospho-CoA kinase